MKADDYKKLTQKLRDLDKKAEELDRVLQDVRIAINDVLWDFIELRKENNKQKWEDKNKTHF